MISLPFMVYWGSAAFRHPVGSLNAFLSIVLKIILVLAVLWMPLSYILSGNLSFTFSNKESFQGGQLAMKLFWYLSYGIGLSTLVILLLYWISLLFIKFSNLKQKDDKQKP